MHMYLQSACITVISDTVSYWALLSFEHPAPVSGKRAKLKMKHLAHLSADNKEVAIVLMVDLD